MSEAPRAYDNPARRAGLPVTTELHVKLSPNEQLTELFESFLSQKGQRQLGERALDVYIRHRQVLHDSSDTHMNVEINRYEHTLRDAYPQHLRVGRYWQFSSDGSHERRARNLFVSMELGGTALRSAIASQPFLRPNEQVVGYVKLPAETLLPAEELEQARRDVTHALSEHPGAKMQYASTHYWVQDPKVVQRQRPRLQVISDR